MNTSSEIISTHCEINLIMAANFQRRYLAISNYFSWAKKFPGLGENQGCGLEISLAKLRSTILKL